MCIIYLPRMRELHISWCLLRIGGLPFLFLYNVILLFLDRLLGIILRYFFGDYVDSLGLFHRSLSQTQYIHLNPLLRILYIQRSMLILLLPVFQSFDSWWFSYDSLRTAIMYRCVKFYLLRGLWRICLKLVQGRGRKCLCAVPNDACFSAAEL